MSIISKLVSLPHVAALLIFPLSILAQSSPEVKRPDIHSGSSLGFEIPTEPIKRTLYHTITEAAENLSHRLKLPICFEILDVDVKGPEREIADLNSIAAFTRELQQLGFKCTRTAEYLLVQKPTSDELVRNPLDARVRDFVFRGSVEDLKSKLMEYIPPPAATGSNVVNIRPPVRIFELRIMGEMTVRELLLRIAVSAKVRWMVRFDTSVELDQSGRARRKVEMARYSVWAL